VNSRTPPERYRFASGKIRREGAEWFLDLKDPVDGKHATFGPFESYKAAFEMAAKYGEVSTSGAAPSKQDLPKPDPPSAAEKGIDLEQRIAAFFLEHGYSATTNQVLTGRSGGRHEIDVLAQRNDGVTSYRVAIECKAWQAPINKDVVAKSAYVCGDLGINKVIIVSLGGWQVGAEIAAEQQGVELWGSTELEDRLGRVGAAGALAGSGRRTALGFATNFDRTLAEKLIVGERWGFFRRRSEAIERIEHVWLPIWVLNLGCAREERHKLRTVSIWNAYEALSGSLVTTLPDQPELREVNLGRSRLVHQITEKSIGRRLANAAEKSWSLVTASAQRRYEDELESLGVPRDARSVTVERGSEAFLPLFVGLLTHEGSQRVMVVDATWGRVWTELGTTLTANIGYLREALGKQWS